MDSAAIYQQANTAAQKAVDDLLAQYGENHGAWMYCGFAWIVIGNVRDPFVKYLKANNLGYKNERKGYTISARVKIQGPKMQSMTLAEEANRAFAEVLKANGIEAHMTSRAD